MTADSGGAHAGAQVEGGVRTEPERGGPSDGAAPTPVHAELIDPAEDAEREAPARQLAVRDGGRMVRGLALIGLGLKTLLFGSKRAER